MPPRQDLGETRAVGNSRLVGRVAAVAAVVIAVMIVAVVLLQSHTSYEVKADFQNASQLVKGNLVEVAGTPVGTVTKLDLTPDGQAQITLHITSSNFQPVRQGTIATVRQASLSGVANRYVDLRLPPGEQKGIRNGGTIRASSTNSAVDLDQLFDAFDPATRRALSGTIRGFSTLYGGRSKQLSQAYLYFNPELASSSRLFSELNYDTPLFARFIVANSKLVTDLAARQSDLTGLISNLANTTGAIATQRAALASSLQQLPPFFQHADRTFASLNTTLDDLTPLVNDSKPVAIALRPFLADLRPLARNSRPTLRDLSALIKNPRPNSDLISLVNSSVPVRDAAIGPVQANGASRPGAFPASTQALNSATPELAYARPYSPDLQSWFNNFSTSGDADALGNASRAAPSINYFAALQSVLPGGTLGNILAPIIDPKNPVLSSVQRVQAFNMAARSNERNRCPGAADHGSVYKPSPDYNCDPSQTLPGS